MDYDRKSNVSSFYGGPKSDDALKAAFPSPTLPHHPSQTQSKPQSQPHAPRDRDDASSFFHPASRRGSTDLLAGGVPRPSQGSAGYNQGSFLHAGREEPLKGGRDEEEAAAERVGDGIWDVFADFNNAGPRYSSAFGQEKGYQKLPPSTPKLENMPTGDSSDPVEMVTVPALGPEWGREEMRNMTKAARKERKAETRRDKVKAWMRDERGICGKYLTRKSLVFTVFGLCAIAAIILGFTIPRVPGFSFNNSTPLLAAGGSFNRSIPTSFNRAPANFSFPAYASLQVDTSSNYLPLKFNSLDATVYDLLTLRQVGSGHLKHKTLAARSFPTLLVPLNFTYVANNDSDATWVNWYNGCRSSAQYANGQRPPVKFLLVLTMKILGLPSSHQTSTQISDAACPFELPQNSA